MYIFLLESSHWYKKYKVNLAFFPFHWCHHLKKIFIFISIWICHHMVCHHMNNIHICHHFGMKFSDGDRYEFFIPSLHTVTFVTVWRLGMKNFHTCHQKSLSDGDGLRGFTIEFFRLKILLTPNFYWHNIVTK